MPIYRILSSTPVSSLQPSNGSVKTAVSPPDETAKPTKKVTFFEQRVLHEGAGKDRAVGALSPGEILIQRELIEQKQREMELKFGRVQPFEDPASPMALPQYQRHSDTVIEREIRAAHMRENSLKREQGRPVMRDGDPLSVEIEVCKPRVAGSDVIVDERAVMRKYAETRMLMELRRERDREVALRSEGTIHTISEQHTGLPIKFIEVTKASQPHQLIHADKQPVRERVKGKGTHSYKEQHNRDLQPDLMMMSQVDDVTSYAVTSHNEMPRAQGAVPRRQVTRAARAPGLPRVFVTYPYMPPGLDEGRGGGQDQGASRWAADQRIEDEMTEARKREEELRSLRELLAAERYTASPVPPGAFSSPLTPTLSISQLSPPLTPTLSVSRRPLYACGFDSGYQGTPEDCHKGRPTSEGTSYQESLEYQGPSQQHQDTSPYVGTYQGSLEYQRLSQQQQDTSLYLECSRRSDEGCSINEDQCNSRCQGTHVSVTSEVAMEAGSESGDDVTEASSSLLDKQTSSKLQREYGELLEYQDSSQCTEDSHQNTPQYTKGDHLDLFKGGDAYELKGAQDASSESQKESENYQEKELSVQESSRNPGHILIQPEQDTDIHSTAPGGHQTVDESLAEAAEASGNTLPDMEEEKATQPPFNADVLFPIGEEGVGLEVKEEGLEEKGVSPEEKWVEIEAKEVCLEGKGAGLEENWLGLEEKEVGLEENGAGHAEKGAGFEEKGAGCEKERKSGRGLARIQGWVKRIVNK